MEICIRMQICTHCAFKVPQNQHKYFDSVRNWFLIIHVLGTYRKLCLSFCTSHLKVLVAWDSGRRVRFKYRGFTSATQCPWTRHLLIE